MTQTRNALIGLTVVGLSLASAGQAFSDEWAILSVNGSQSLGAPFIGVGDDSAFYGSTGCNTFSGSATFHDGQLRVAGPLALTQMACPPDGLDEQERAILNLFDDYPNFSYDPIAKSFTLSTDSASLTLVAASASVQTARYVSVVGVDRYLNVRSGAGTDAAVVTRALPGTLLRNLGCETGADRTWCNISYLGSDAVTGWAAADFLAAAPATIRAQQSLFDGIGTVSCQDASSGGEQRCDYGVARDGDHTAVLVIYTVDGEKQVLHFLDGALAYAEADNSISLQDVQSDVADTEVRVRIDGQTFDFPLSVIVGNQQ